MLYTIIIKNGGKDMNVTYINHSGFIVETESCYIIFDYFNGELPEFGDKPIYIFSSHGHQDHFNREIFNMCDDDKVKYILSGDIRKKIKSINSGNILFVYPRKEYELDSLKIKTLKSTDIGVAFIVEVDGAKIYHGGDLNCWMWQEENRQYNNSMKSAYEREIKSIAGETFDIAFVPLDPRQDEYYDMGMKFILSQCHILNIFPMHMWEEYSVQDKFLMESNNNLGDTKFYKISEKNETWRI